MTTALSAVRSKIPLYHGVNIIKLFSSSPTMLHKARAFLPDNFVHVGLVGIYDPGLNG